MNIDQAINQKSFVGSGDFEVLVYGLVGNLNCSSYIFMNCT
jgi:hypothetical protein